MKPWVKMHLNETPMRMMHLNVWMKTKVYSCLIEFIYHNRGRVGGDS